MGQERASKGAHQASILSHQRFLRKFAAAAYLP